MSVSLEVNHWAAILENFVIALIGPHDFFVILRHPPSIPKSRKEVSLVSLTLEENFADVEMLQLLT